MGLDFTHQQDNSTIIESQKTKVQITINATKDGRSLIKNYIRRNKDVDVLDVLKNLDLVSRLKTAFFMVDIQRIRILLIQTILEFYSSNIETR